jgi:hypothetical protein
MKLFRWFAALFDRRIYVDKKPLRGTIISNWYGRIGGMPQ